VRWIRHDGVARIVFRGAHHPAGTGAVVRLAWHPPPSFDTSVEGGTRGSDARRIALPPGLRRQVKGERVKATGLVILTLLTISVGTAGAATVDFAGTWVLNKAKSAGEIRGVGEMMVVAVDDRELTCDVNGDKARRSTFRLDGKKTTWQLESGTVIKRFTGELSVLQEGGALEVTRRVEYFGRVETAGSMIKKTVKLDRPEETSKAVWTLQDGGKELLVKTEDGTHLVFERQSKN
jgi:hypothetical protein